MNASERRMEIFRILSENSNIEVADLANRFQVSGMTIRRDLASFEKQGLVTTTYGGAYLNKDVSSMEPSFSEKSSQMLAAKQRIAQKAASFIADGDTIIIDCGTTTMQIAKSIQDKKLRVITNSWPLVNYLGASPKIELLLLPGVYDDISAGAFGESTINYVKNLHADKVFIGTHGWGLDAGATVPMQRDAEVKRALLDAGKTAWLLADQSKYGRTYFAAHAQLGEFDYIISDGFADEVKARLKGKPPKMIVA